MNGESTGDRSGRKGKPRRDERRAQRLARGRRDILDAAERALGARGDLQALTMDEIAKEAGYTPGALYGYFSNKGAIVTALLKRIEEEMIAVIDAPAPDGTPFLERLERLLAGLNGLARQHIGLFHAFLVMGWSPGEEDLHEMWALHEAFLARLDRIFDQGMREGRIRRMAPRDLSVALIGVQREYFIHWLFSDRSVPLEERSRTAATIFLRGAAAPTDEREKEDR